MEKAFYPKLFFLPQMILYIVFLFSLGLFFNYIENFSPPIVGTDWVLILFSLIGISLFLLVFPRISCRVIKVMTNGIFVSADFGFSPNKLQYQLIFPYGRIDEIELDYSHNNSLNQKIKGAKFPRIHIVFKLNNGTEARIVTHFFSRKQIIKVIDLVIENVRLLNDDFENRSGTELWIELCKRFPMDKMRFVKRRNKDGK